jgi:hypothetical protein
LTARRSSKKPRRKSPAKRDQSAPRSRSPDAKETDERDVLETPEQLEEKLAPAEHEVARLAQSIVNSNLGLTAAKREGDDAHHIRLQQREFDDVAQAVCQFADPYFGHFCADADGANRKFARKIKQSDGLRDLIGCDQLSLEQLAELFEALTFEYIKGPATEGSPFANLAGKFSTLPVSELESRKETLRAAAQYLLDDSHSGALAALLRDKELASELAELVIRYTWVVECERQLQRQLSVPPRRRGHPQSPFGKFAWIAYQILDPLPDRKRLDLIVPFGDEFFGEGTTLRKLRDRLTQARARQPRSAD